LRRQKPLRSSHSHPSRRNPKRVLLYFILAVKSSVADGDEQGRVSKFSEQWV